MADDFKPPKGRMKKAPEIKKKDEAGVLNWINERIWKKVKRGMGRFPLTTDLLAAYYCVTDTTTAAPAKPRLALLGFGRLFYFSCRCHTRFSIRFWI